MAYSYVWPVTLPQAPQKGYSEQLGSNILRTPMDAGPAKQRLRGKSPNNLSVSFLMNTSQVATLEDFVFNTLRSVYRFGFKHPRTGNMVEVRIIPQSGGTLYTLVYVAPGYYNISLQLEILP